MLVMCNTCKLEKDISCFSKRGDSVSGYRKNCKYCESQKHKKYYLENTEKIKSNVKKYSENNKEDISLKRKLYWKDYYSNNKDTVGEYQSNYRKNNKLKCNERVKKWRNTERGKEICIIKEGKRRALKKSSCDGTVTIDKTQELFNTQGGVCNYCGLDLTANKKHLDHIIPLSRGGVHSIFNLQWLCATCNLKKSNKIIISN